VYGRNKSGHDGYLQTTYVIWLLKRPRLAGNEMASLGIRRDEADASLCIESPAALDPFPIASALTVAQLDAKVFQVIGEICFGVGHGQLATIRPPRQLS